MKAFLALLLALLLPAGAALADKLPLSEISAYLNGLGSARGTFVQINDDGSRATGTLLIKRPGRLRFEYDGKDAPKVVASSGAVVVYDPKSNTPPETYPLQRTPLSLILDSNIDLTRANMVVGHRAEGNATVVTAQDPKNPQSGRIDMVFSGNPVALTSWVITDEAGGRTRVTLSTLDTSVNLRNGIFSTQALQELNASDR
jgi:outer membrane lipoprotein-sorting protein